MASEGQTTEKADLARIAADAWRLLAHGAANRRHGFHTPVLGTRGAQGEPQLRSVVLREADADRLSLRAHCDRRSRKADEIAADPRVSLLFYDREEKVQLRVSGHAGLHCDDEVAREAWAQTTLFGRRCYLQEPGPSAPSAAPTSGLPDDLQKREPGARESDAGFANFAVILVRVESLDWLHLHHEGHRRACFVWDAQGQRQDSWLVP